MDKKQFLDFCKREFESHGCVRQKKAFYRLGNNLLCGIDLQASIYGKAYYVNYYFFWTILKTRRFSRPIMKAISMGELGL